MGLRRVLIALGAATALTLPAAAAAATLKTGDLLVVNYEDDTTARTGVIKVDPVTGKQSLISSNEQAINQGSSELFDGTWDLLLLPNGELVVSNAGGAGLIGVNVATGKQRLISANSQPINTTSSYFSFPVGVVRLPDGDLAVGSGPPVGVVRVDPSNGKQSILSSNDQPINASSALFTNVYDLASGPRGKLVVADADAFAGGEGGLIGVDPSTGKQTELSSNVQAVNASSSHFETPASAQLYRGTLYVSDASTDGGGVIAVNPATGKQRLVSSNGQAINSGSAFFDNPYGIAVEPGGRILVTSETGFADGQGGVIATNPLTGKQSILTNNVDPPNAGSSELIDYPDGILVVPPKCAGQYPTIVGSAKKDKLRGTRFADVIVGLGGNDRILGLKGKDRLCGGKGRDRIRGGRGRDRIIGGPGRDITRQ